MFLLCFQPYSLPGAANKRTATVILVRVVELDWKNQQPGMHTEVFSHVFADPSVRGSFGKQMAFDINDFHKKMKERENSFFSKKKKKSLVKQGLRPEKEPTGQCSVFR